MRKFADIMLQLLKISKKKRLNSYNLRSLKFKKVQENYKI